MGGKGKRVKDVDKLKKEKGKKVEEKKEEKPKKIEKPIEARTIIRVSGTDLIGDKSLIHALRGIKGVSYAMANAICVVGNFDPNSKLSSFSESQIEKLEQIIKDPIKAGIPNFLVNRKRDRETGKDVHLTGPDIDVATKFDVKRHVDLKTYRGWRHILGQPVRGQRTRSKFREKGRVVGVLRKAIRIQMAKTAEAGAAPAEKKAEKKE